MTAPTPTTPPACFQKMTGQWVGECKTWFEPDQLSDQSSVEGTIECVMGNFLRHTYKGSMQGKPRKGEELIGFERITGKFQVSWIDDFHMSQAIMFSEGGSLENGFSVQGLYEVGADHAPWGWRTTYQVDGDDQLIIVAYNITPDGQEARATETVYRRVCD